MTTGQGIYEVGDLVRLHAKAEIKTLRESRDPGIDGIEGSRDCTTADKRHDFKLSRMMVGAVKDNRRQR